MARLIFSLDEGEEVVVPLEGTISVGREDDNDVMIDDERISRHHAELVVHQDGRIEILDVGSTAGTFVNGRPVRTAFVKPGDKVAIGPVLGRIEDDTAAPSSNASVELQQQIDKLQSELAVTEAKHRELTRETFALSADLKSLAESRAAAESEINNLARQRDDEVARLKKVRDEVAVEERRVAALRDEATALEKQRAARVAEHEKLEVSLRALTAECDQLAARQLEMAAEAERADSEGPARAMELAATTRRLEDATAKLAEAESRLGELADLDRRIREAKEQLSAIEQRAADAQVGLHQTEAEAKSRMAELSAREDEVRAAAAVASTSTTVQSARDELEGLETRLTPLRDWKKAMDDRQARLAKATPGSAEEGRLMNEIDEAYGTLYDLLPSAQIATHGTSRTDFVRARTKAGVPMKSERIRRADR